MPAVLDLFLPAVGRWFAESFGEPTRPQTEAWPHIAAGDNTLVIAPTGSGKTLAAFLWGIDALCRAGRERRLHDRVHLVYVSPLKALNNDIEKNLRAPLAGIREMAARLGDPLPEIRVAVRTGDTLAHVRQAMIRRPPHVLITTPESLYLLLTSEKFRPALTSVETVIVDEVHALAGNKRGAHLALSLERLQALAEGPIQRIGCSATVRPPSAAAEFLAGAGRPCRIVDAGFDRALDLEVVAPVPDFLEAVSDTVWDAALQELTGWIEAHRTTLVFTPSRRMAERLARNLNERLPRDHVAAHHGSLSRRARLDAEERLKRGELRALVATSSLELGIDVGAIDLVVQLQSPRNIAAALQRVGRSGHALSRTSKGRILVTKGDELLEAAALARAIREQDLDRLELAEAPLDVLAQQVVAAVAAESWRLEDLHALLTRAAPYRGLEFESFVAVVRSLAEPLPAEVKGAAPRILWDKVNGRLHARRGSRLLALTSGGTIADAGLLDVYLADTDVKLGTLDEEFVSESLPGDVFLLGSRPWRLLKTTANRVLVEDAAGMSPTVPFWKGEHPSRTWDLGRLCGRLRREAAARLDSVDFEDWARRICGLDARAASALRSWLTKGRDLLGVIPHDGHVVVESLPDDLGGRHLAIHSVFGMRVNGAWGLALREALRRLGILGETSHTDDAILLSFAPGQTPPAPERLLTLVDPAEAEELVVAGLIGSPLFTTRFRHCAVRALAIARMTRGQRTPAWLQRLKADALLEAVGGRPDFPLVAETLRECCHDALDVPRLTRLLEGLQDGEVSTGVAYAAMPSPFVYPLLLAWDWAYLDTGHAEERRSDAIPMGKRLGAPRGPLDPALVSTLEAELQHTTPAGRARDANELAALLETLGDLDEAEIADRVVGDASELIAALQAEGRVRPASFSNGRIAWAGADEAELWQSLEAGGLTRILIRCLRHRGPVTAAWLGARYGLAIDRLEPELGRLVAEGAVAAGGFLPGAPATEYVHRAVLEELQRRAAVERRGSGSRTVSGEDFRAFLLRWQHVQPERRLAGPGGMLSVLGQLQGEDFPVRFWEQEILPARLEVYDPRDLDALGLGGQAVWTPFERGSPGRVGVALRENLGWLRAEAGAEAELGATAKNVLRHLELQGASFVQDLLRATGLAHYELITILWDLFWQGLCSPDSFELIRRAPTRPLPSPSSLRLPPGWPTRRAAKRRARKRLSPSPPLLGRWSALGHEPASLSPEERQERRARLLLQRFGIVARELAANDWGALRQTLTRMEYAGEVERGYFVEGLSGEQYALPEAIRDLGAGPRRRQRLVRVSLADPASLWSGVFPLSRPDGSRVQAPRLAQNLVVARGGRALLLAEGNGRSLTPLEGFEAGELPELVRALLEPWDRPLAQRQVRRMEVATWDGAPVRHSSAAPVLIAAGFYPDGDRLSFDGFPGPTAAPSRRSP